MTVPHPNMLVVRVYRVGDPLVSVMQVAMGIREGMAFATFIGGGIIDAMTDTSGDEYGYVTEPAYAELEWLPATPRLGWLVNIARCIAATHDVVQHS